MGAAFDQKVDLVPAELVAQLGRSAVHQRPLGPSDQRGSPTSGEAPTVVAVILMQVFALPSETGTLPLDRTSPRTVHSQLEDTQGPQPLANGPSTRTYAGIRSE
jgi:hypothetical protein